MGVIAVSKQYNTRPSTLLGVEDEYTAYCLDEAATVIARRLEDGEKPMFHKEYATFSDMYAEFDVKGVSK